ncbi:MAG: tetratricopeptide repeat protein [Isosphaeraceae bacterium]
MRQVVASRRGRSCGPLLGLVVIGFVVAAQPARTSAQAILDAGSVDGRIPFDRLRDWSNSNNAGHRALARGDLDRAASAFHLAIETVRPYEARERMLMARSNADFAQVLYLQKRYDEAEPLARWALEVRKQFPGDRSEALVQNYLLLARIERARKRPAEAAPLLAQALAIQEKAIGPYHTNLTETLEEMADVHAEQGKLSDAEKSYRRALALRELNSERNLKEAERLELRAEFLGDVANADNGVIGVNGNSLIGRGQDAERLRIQARAAREASAASQSSAATAQRFAVTLRRAGKTDEADDMEVRARAMRDEAETRAARARAER